jgi:hypothetical protein
MLANASSPADRGVLGGTHYAPKAKRIIYLFMSGGPSHLDLLDYKPLLNKRHGQWVIVVCGGDGLRQASTLAQTGMKAAEAQALAMKLQAAESRLPAETLRKFASFEGMLRLDGGAHGAHGTHPKH